MTFNTFDDLFLWATGERRFPYQAEFANAKDLFELVHAPTGAGKTATVILGWLWRLRYAGEDVRSSTPHRLVYCLPMRFSSSKPGTVRLTGWVSLVCAIK